MWATDQPYADPDFPQGFARDVDGRLWEMYLGCTLLESGRTLLPVIEGSARAVSPICASSRAGAASGSRRSRQTKVALVPTASSAKAKSSTSRKKALERRPRVSFSQYQINETSMDSGGRGGRDALGPVFPLFAPCDCRGHLQLAYARAERHLRHPMSDLFRGGIP
jgi:hypothetical protein